MLAACGDDDRSGGTDAGPGLDGRVDPAPFVRNTTPEDGAADVPRREPLIIRFSEPMDRESGTLVVDPGMVPPRAAWTWDATGSILTVRPNVPWVAGEVTVTVSDFVDDGGVAMEEPYVFTINALDDEPPFVTAASPTEGETGLSARLASIDFTFNEPMDTSFGRLDALGGSAEFGEPVWSADGTMVSFPTSNLEYERAYEVTLSGFRDVAGNPLDGEPVLEDGILDFSTGPDMDTPRVVMSIPMEGQVDVNAAIANEIFITFDEAMDTSITEFEFSDGTTTQTLSGRWTQGNTVLRVVIAGLIEYDTSYSLDVSNTRDARGNLVDPVAYLGDGKLDFMASNDVFAPIVVRSTPVEGQMGIDQKERINIEVVFSEAMDQTITMTTLSGGGQTVDVAANWTSPTTATFFVDGNRLRARTTYSLDLTAFEDLSGTPTDATHRYLMDGRLDFTTGAPTGEACGDALSELDATREEGVYRYAIASSSVTSREGGTNACADYTGSALRPDAVISYDKTTGDVASGGRLLKVTTTGGSTSTSFDMAIIPGACDPSATPVRCAAHSEVHTLYADVPAGTVHIWVSPNSSSSFSTSMVVEVEEVVPPRPEGEACDNPWTTSSAVFSTAAGVDTFLLPANSARAMDISPYTRDGLISCDPTSSSSTSSENGTGVDQVIRYTMPADSILRVTADGVDSSLNNEFNVTAFSTCDVTPTSTELGCIGDVSTTVKEGIIDAPPGDLYIWLTNNQTDIYRSTSSGDYFFHEVELKIERIPVAEGETCSRAYAATTGTNTVNGTSGASWNSPTCFPSTSNVEWYRVTTGGGRVQVSTTGAGGLALFQGSQQLGCSVDGSTTGVESLIASGTDVCVAIEQGTSITAFDVTETAYTGVGVNPPVDLPIERPINTAGNVEFITGETWMSGNSNVLVVGYNAAGEMLESLKDGSGSSIYRSPDDGLSTANVGYVGVFAASGALFSFDDSLSTSGSRVYRLWDGASPLWSPTPWDVPAPTTYPAEPIAAANVVGDTLYFVTADDFPVFYSMSATTPGAPVRLGTNEIVTDVTGIAVDDTYVYVAGEYTTTGIEGVFRLPLAELGNPTYPAINIAPGIDHDGAALPFGPVNMFVDSTSSPSYLYVRNAAGHVEAIQNPGGSSDYIGEVITVGTPTDQSMWLDPATGSLYLFETDSDANGNFLRFDP